MRFFFISRGGGARGRFRVKCRMAYYVVGTCGVCRIVLPFVVEGDHVVVGRATGVGGVLYV